ncbi:hypothetical protein [Streptomyces sp. N35]|uniref:hypothetical protein n=1 Tax=Streptomyces sp. N35 TaxID=2795730 RepID=UPI0018F67261|nr:hypothetical protein [Streptomyces sp. N35]
MRVAQRGAAHKTQDAALFDIPEPTPGFVWGEDVCMWHLDDPPPPARHRTIIAVDLMHPRWWKYGSLPDRGLRGAGGGGVRLYKVGAPVCEEHIAEYPEKHDASDRRFGLIIHFAPNSPKEQEK